MRSCLLSTLESLLLSINIAGSQSTGTPPSLSSIRLLCTPTSRCKTCTFFFESCPTGWHFHDARHGLNQLPSVVELNQVALYEVHSHPVEIPVTNPFSLHARAHLILPRGTFPSHNSGAMLVNLDFHLAFPPVSITPSERPSYHVPRWRSFCESQPTDE
ncbi:hypothetical protein EDD16DRAFT_1673943 [Pisolithus croceorrhizus]|nr:hypothetical protein EDD16DRAFT_1673943 [Pisolithus croceorrhizus]